IRDFIDNSGNPEKGRRIQFEIDMERVRTAPGEQTYLAMGKRLILLLGQMSDLFRDIQAIASRENVKRVPARTQ
ncbi:MAG TPA: hypothetical protein VFF03_13855, partial [Rhodocyclaceae bacterium]|nr:hypothetical protein [Rhodocyclaceae bacterium]